MKFLYLSAILLTFLSRISLSKRINTFIPQYCSPLLHSQSLNIEQLGSAGNDSAIVVTAYFHEGLELKEGYECYIIVRAPKGHGIVTTVKKISFHDNDTLVFQSSSNDQNVWVSGDDPDYKRKEVLAFPRIDEQSSIRIKYVPAVKRSQHMAGFEVAFTSFRDKREAGCGEDFDCGNDRCISHDFQCDSYNNCGNEADEEGCAGISWWIIVLLIALGVLVVVLAIFVWYRMAQR